MTPPSRVRAELLKELREAAPMAVAPEPAGRRPQPAAPAGEQPGSAFELRVTTQPWSPLRISGLPGGPGVSAALGPLRLSLRMPGR
jgi:hypothetical protein